MNKIPGWVVFAAWTVFAATLVHAVRKIRRRSLRLVDDAETDCTMYFFGGPHDGNTVLSNRRPAHGDEFNVPWFTGEKKNDLPVVSRFLSYRYDEARRGFVFEKYLTLEEAGCTPLEPEDEPDR